MVQVQIEHGRQHQIRILAALMRRILGVMLAEIGGIWGVYWGFIRGILGACRGSAAIS